MIGYHYTTKEAWKKIRKVGLLPQTISGDDSDNMYRQIQSLTGTYPLPIKACWIWENQQLDVIRMGHILMIHKHHPTEKTFVELRVEFDLKEDTWGVPHKKYGKQLIQIKHNGTINFANADLLYHQSEPVRLVTVPIPPERITRLESFNFHETKRQLMMQIDTVDTSA